MRNRTLILGIAAVIAIGFGLAAGFFELTVLGVIAALASVILGVRSKFANELPER